MKFLLVLLLLLSGVATRAQGTTLRTKYWVGNTGNWADALDASGVAYRDEGYSFIYVDP